MKFYKSDYGLKTAECEHCGRTYDLTDSWDIANLDWHQCQEVGA